MNRHKRHTLFFCPSDNSNRDPLALHGTDVYATLTSLEVRGQASRNARSPTSNEIYPENFSHDPLGVWLRGSLDERN